MLFMSSANKIVRIHGPYISEKEIEKITDILKSQGEPDYVDEITAENKNDDVDLTSAEDEDNLYQKAVEIIKAEGKASTSFFNENYKLDTIELLE